MKQALDKSDKSLSVESKIAKFLAAYRNTPHVTTNKIPVELLLKRSPRMRLSLIHPCVENRMKTVAEKGVGDRKPRMFKEGQSVALRDFCPHATTKWRQALVKKQMGPLTYKVEVTGQVHSAHVDHLKPWPVDSLPSSTPLSGNILSNRPLEFSRSGSNDNSKTATASFLVPVTDDEPEEQNRHTVPVTTNILEILHVD